MTNAAPPPAPQPPAQSAAQLAAQRAAQSAAPLRLFNSLTRRAEDFVPVHAGQARVYTCGPTVYNYPHIGNMRAYVFADTLGRALSFCGYALKHIINITDVGHLTDDADAGEDKMERMAAARAQSIWDVAQHYTQAYWADVKSLNIRQPATWSIATDYVPQMIEFAKSIADKHCYQIASGLYFDTATVADYGRLARAATDEGEGRIEAVAGKRNAADFAIWRATPPGETRQMEWDSPWGRGAPGWHLECSVMSRELLGLPFDIHTGGIDHREIHHPNEIAQNQAITACGTLDCAENSGARIWMHNNFLIDRTGRDDGGKMSKSSGEFLRLQLLMDRGFHPLAYRMMCLQAHYRSEMEFSWDGLAAAFVRLKRLVLAIEGLRAKTSGATDADAALVDNADYARQHFGQFYQSAHDLICDDLNTSSLLVLFETMIFSKSAGAAQDALKLRAVEAIDAILGLDLARLRRADLRVQPAGATISPQQIEAALETRRAARAAKDFATSDRLRDELISAGVDVMDGDPLGWDWRPRV
ncbi:MAG: cysteine--tRNA ligase [Sphingopyxis sp.]